jgi:hypothetical protein
MATRRRLSHPELGPHPRPPALDRMGASRAEARWLDDRLDGRGSDHRPIVQAFFSQMMSEYLYISVRGAAPLVLACLVVFPVALVLAASSQRRGPGPTWRELLGPLVGLRRPEWGAASYDFGWPVHRGADRLYALLTTELDEVVLVRHDRHDHPPYHTLPGGTIQLADESPVDCIAPVLGAAASRVEDWSLIHVERRGRHQDLVYSGLLSSADLDTARAATRHHLRSIPLSSEALAHVDVHPHGVADVVRKVAAEKRGSAPPESPRDSDQRLR